MRKATFAKLSLTAAVGFGTLFHAGTAQAQTPPKQLDQTGDIKWAPAPPTTIGPIVAIPVDPDPDPPFDPDLPIAQPEADDCEPICDKAPVPQPDPEPECNPHLLCGDEVLTDAGCTWTHGCPEDPDPECNPIALCDEITSDPGCTITHGDCGGGDEGTDDGGDESTTGGEDECHDALGGPQGPAELCVDTDDGGEGTTGGGSLPRTGAEMATWAIAGLGLTGIGAALRKAGKRADAAE